MLSGFLTPNSVRRIGDKQEGDHFLFWILDSRAAFVDLSTRKDRKCRTALKWTRFP